LGHFTFVPGASGAASFSPALHLLHAMVTPRAASALGAALTRGTKLEPHLGHFTRFPGVGAAASFKFALQSGQLRMAMGRFL